MALEAFTFHTPIIHSHHLLHPINNPPILSLQKFSTVVSTMFFFSPHLLPLILLFIIFDSHISHPTPNYLKFPLHRISHNLSSTTTATIQSTLRSPLISGASTGSGQYLVSISLGTPPQPLLLVADTGSDLIWAHSSPCRTNCSLHHHKYNHKNSSPSLFFPRRSSSFSPTHCYSPLCTRLVPRAATPTRHCNRTRLHSPCFFDYAYSDGSRASGIFATETLSFHSPKSNSKSNYSHLKLHFGSGFNLSGPSVTGPSFNGANGVLGLGREPISFASQLGRKFGSTKFSYCLLDYTLAPPQTSYLVIGSRNDAVLGNYSSTRLIRNPLSPTFYYIGVESLLIDEVRLEIDPSVWGLDEGTGTGGTVIDTGTTLSFFPKKAYNVMLSELRKRVKAVEVEEATPGFDLCVKASEVSMVLPRLRIGVEGGDLFEPPTGNYWIETEEGVMCLAVKEVVGEASGFAVIGNLMQQGFVFEFDVGENRVRFSGDVKGCADR